MKLGNSLQTELRTSASLSAFKKEIKSIFCSLIGKKRFNVSLNRWASILHARLRLGSHALNEYLFKIKQLLDEVFVICRIINVEVRVFSRAEGEADNSYRDIDNSAYHKNRIR